MLDDSSNERDALCARMERLNRDTERLDAYTVEAQRDAQASPGRTPRCLFCCLLHCLATAQTCGGTAWLETKLPHAVLGYVKLDYSSGGWQQRGLV